MTQRKTGVSSDHGKGSFRGKSLIRFLDLKSLLGSLPLTAFVVFVAFPGFMSYDSLRMLEEATTQVQGGIYPTGPVYLLYILNLFGHGSTVMWILQVFALNYSSWVTLRCLTRTSWSAVIFSVLSLALPYILGAQLVLWKDVTVAAFWMTSLALILTEDKGPGKWKPLKRLLPFVLMLAGTLLRFNSVFLFVPLFLFATVRSLGVARKGLLALITLFGVAVAALLNLFMASYSIPDLRPLPKSTNWLATQSYDLVGISYYSETSLLPVGRKTLEESVPSSDIALVFSTLGALEIANRAQALPDFRLYSDDYSNEDIGDAWIEAVLDHPAAYLKYRFALTREILGISEGPTFEATHYNLIDENTFGLAPWLGPATLPTVTLIYNLSSEPIGKPWLLMIASVLMLMLLRWGPLSKNRSVLITLAGSATLYLATFVILTATGEVRYFFPSGILYLVFVSYVSTQLWSRFQALLTGH